MTTTSSKGGRPSKFRPEFVEQARKLALLGLTNEEMAKFFEVGLTTFDRWLAREPEFRSAIKTAKELADADVVTSLYKRATGYSHDDVHVSNYQGDVTLTPIVKHYPPDPTAMIFWLKNRQPSRYRDRPTPMDGDDVPLPVKVEISVKDARIRGDDQSDAE